MTSPFTGPGDNVERHNLDPSAHAGLFLGTSAVAGPRLLVPPGAVFAATAVAAWPASNQIILMRVHVPVTKSYRYLNLNVGTSSGSIQAGIASVTLADATSCYFTRVAHTGTIACPTAGSNRLDLGETSLAAGDYALFLWCDNTTATFANGATSGLSASRLLFGNGSLTTGLGSGLTQISASTRWVAGLTLEAST